MRQQQAADSGSIGLLPQTAYKDKVFKNKKSKFVSLRSTELRGI